VYPPPRRRIGFDMPQPAGYVGAWWISLEGRSSFQVFSVGSLIHRDSGDFYLRQRLQFNVRLAKSIPVLRPPPVTWLVFFLWSTP